ncbi:MAG: hypothetical protein B7X86_04160 [Sphingobacteriales bacterium 17-39-43]|uniref:DUF6503 family protein n=1 Tax=Daejeonella sp. TaxID=2805397 RepID=UPI000BD9CE73|nr:DUF6503 family protein [Daejeonella sp.]OYZ32530.1 MAG: hypothetical protein B7Y24_04985 [Sphingobacteriales bacterium 16-39-50]OZA25893.1 MAG: hypothetical protein B7X86_04160 [Sphingobacteriales bacterium 17-39-43]HQS06249.1 hypothetical protein [Daejeonella sp.]HQT21908.1 hypothetical protein [Daejeonella sp.]HQT57215.1 hypothetical protein [Daejeonella sp.]
MNRLSYLILMLFIISGCNEPDARKIVDKSIAFYNMDKLTNSTLEFTFRTARFKVMQNGGQFNYERFFSDSTGNVHDILSNDGFKRILDGKELKLDQKDTDKYRQSLNAVVYFLYLPLKLNDASVVKKYIGKSQIKGKTYHKIEISFEKSKEAGDHSDVFYYWFDIEDYSMDHFAYSSGGNRFRDVLRTQEVGGVIFQDYVNYQMPLDDSVTTVDKYDSLYEAGRLRVLSQIELKDIVLK